MRNTTLLRTVLAIGIVLLSNIGMAEVIPADADPQQQPPAVYHPPIKLPERNTVEGMSAFYHQLRLSPAPKFSIEAPPGLAAEWTTHFISFTPAAHTAPERPEAPLEAKPTVLTFAWAHIARLQPQRPSTPADAARTALDQLYADITTYLTRMNENK